MTELERLTTDHSKDAETLAGISLAVVRGRGILGQHRANPQSKQEVHCLH